MISKNSELYFKREKQLGNLDWDCSDQFHQKTSLNILHWYPASFITAIPGNVIDVFTKPGDVVWDPFCGSGTTAIESFRKGRQFIGNDINSIAILITEAKINILEIRDSLNSEIEELKAYLMHITFANRFNADLSKFFEPGKNACFYEELSYWYHPSTQRDLTILWGSILEYDCSEKFRNILKIIFLNIAKIASAQQKTWGHIADNVKPKPFQIEKRRYDPIPTFLTRIRQLSEKVNKIVISNANGSVDLECIDTRIFKPHCKVDLVITSPPYPSMADYVTSQRLGYYWLGFDVKSINDTKSNEIGARYRRHSKYKNNQYLSGMIDSLDNIFLHMRKGGYLAMLLPQYRENDPREEIVNKMCSHCSKHLSQLYSIHRTVDDSNRWAPFKTLKSETLRIWGKDD